MLDGEFNKLNLCLYSAPTPPPYYLKVWEREFNKTKPVPLLAKPVPLLSQGVGARIQQALRREACELVV